MSLLLMRGESLLLITQLFMAAMVIMQVHVGKTFKEVLIPISRLYQSGKVEMQEEHSCPAILLTCIVQELTQVQKFLQDLREQCQQILLAQDKTLMATLQAG